MFDRHQGGQAAVLVHVDFPLAGQHEASREDELEFVELVKSAGVEVLALLRAKREHPHPSTFIGSGKVEELRALVAQVSAPLVLFNHQLTPAQERNLERQLNCRVVDRVGLILDIFAQRAHTHEGKLQVELAQLRHLSTRLVRGWTHLGRQKGGIGLRGPGETQLETDRRLIRERMRWIQARLERVTRQREQGRRGRKRAALPTVAIVGYTNAGKSTLFNRLTQADVYAADQLFATLDPTLRKIHWSETGPFILADTVGFIRHLPHDLVAAFRATLEETREAQLLLHVIDASDPRRDENIDQVEQVLDDIGAGTVPRIRIYNKIDRLASIEAKWRDAEPPEEPSVWLSVKTGEGLTLLKEAIVRGLGDTIVDLKLKLPPEAARIRARLYQQQMIISETVADDGSSLLHVRSSKVAWERLRQKENVDFNAFMT